MFFSNEDPLNITCEKLLMSGISDMRHVFDRVLTEAAVRIDDALSQGTPVKGLRVIIDVIGRLVVLEHDAGRDDLDDIIQRLGFEVLIK